MEDLCERSAEQDMAGPCCGSLSVCLHPVHELLHYYHAFTILVLVLVLVQYSSIESIRVSIDCSFTPIKLVGYKQQVQFKYKFS
jgi:hypothetical protein